VIVERQPAHVCAQERRVILLGCCPGKSHFGQVDAGHLPAGRGEVPGLGGQTQPTSRARPLAGSQPSSSAETSSGEGRERCHHK
jgi:hypothetical protein